MLDLGNAVTITRTDAKNRSDFAGTFVSKKKPYKKTDHTTNVLLALLLAGHMRDHMAGKTSAGDAAASVWRGEGRGSHRRGRRAPLGEHVPGGSSGNRAARRYCGRQRQSTRFWCARPILRAAERRLQGSAQAAARD